MQTGASLLLLMLLSPSVLSENEIIHKFLEQYSVPRSCDSLPKFSDYSPNLKYLDELLHPTDRPSTRSLEEYVLLLLPYIECSPPSAKVLRRPKNLTYNCHAPGWLGPREKPKRIVDIFPVAHEMDILEMRLYELDDVVDKFVIFENMYTHRVWKRPLFFERSKVRFRNFIHKIHHIVADDSTGVARNYNPGEKQRNGDDFRGEEVMRLLPWKAFKDIVGSEEAMTETIFIHSDLDEIPNAETIMQYKHCVPGAGLDLPIVLTATFYRHNFDWVIWDDEKPILFEGRHMAQQFGHKLPRYTDGKVHNKHNDPSQRSITVNRMTNAYGDIFKDLALAEGGYVPRQPNMGRQIILDPLVTNEWRRKGIRNCCTGDSEHLKKRSPGMPIPWFAWHNKHRFSEYFPEECAANPEECRP